MEDNAIRALRDLINDLRVEVKSDAIDNATWKQRVITLLEGDPADKKNPGIIARVEEVERWQEKIKSRDKRIAVWVGAVIGVGSAALAIFKWIQSIMK